MKDSNIFAGTWYGVLLSTNNGTSWSVVDSNFVYSFAVSGNSIFAGRGEGVFMSTDNGKKWTDVNSGLPTNLRIYSLAVNDSNIFAGTADGGIWRRPLSEMIGVTSNEQRVVAQQSRVLNLIVSNQSFHNVAINFSLAQSQMVTLRIFTLSGREIATLINKHLGAGEHSLSWDTKNMAAGCYAVKMQVGSNVVVKNIPVSH